MGKERAIFSKTDNTVSKTLGANSSCEDTSKLFGNEVSLPYKQASLNPRPYAKPGTKIGPSNRSSVRHHGSGSHVNARQRGGAPTIGRHPADGRTIGENHAAKQSAQQ